MPEPETANLCPHGTLLRICIRCIAAKYEAKDAQIAALTKHAERLRAALQELVTRGYIVNSDDPEFFAQVTRALSEVAP